MLFVETSKATTHPFKSLPKSDNIEIHVNLLCSTPSNPNIARISGNIPQNHQRFFKIFTTLGRKSCRGVIAVVFFLCQVMGGFGHIFGPLGLGGLIAFCAIWSPTKIPRGKAGKRFLLKVPDMMVYEIIHTELGSIIKYIP